MEKSEFFHLMNSITTLHDMIIIVIMITNTYQKFIISQALY